MKHGERSRERETDRERKRDAERRQTDTSRDTQRVKVASHYSGLAARSSVKNDSSRMSKLTALSHCTLQSVGMGDKTAGTSLASVFISCVYAYSLV